MGYKPHKKAALLIPYNDVPHLFVVMNDPDANGDCLLVMATSVKKGRSCDRSCVLNKGCHSFVQHETYILYRMSELVSARHIGNMVDKKFYQQKSDVSQVVFDRIRTGLYSSDDTKQRIIDFASAVGV